MLYVLGSCMTQRTWLLRQRYDRIRLLLSRFSHVWGLLGCWSVTRYDPWKSTQADDRSLPARPSQRLPSVCVCLFPLCSPFLMLWLSSPPLNLLSTLPLPWPFLLPLMYSVVGVLMDFLNGDGAMDVILFVRSIVEQYEVREGGLTFACVCTP